MQIAKFGLVGQRFKLKLYLKGEVMAAPPCPPQECAAVSCVSPKKHIILHPHPQALPPATSIKFAQNTVRNHKKKAEQMFSCTSFRMGETHGSGTGWGDPLWSVCPQRVFWGEDTALGFFSFQRYCWTRLEDWKYPIIHRIAFFPLFFWPKEIPEGWGELAPSIWGA